MASVAWDSITAFGHNHTQYTKVQLQAILDEFRVKAPANANLHALLVAVEKIGVRARAQKGTTPTEYLSAAFDPATYKNAHFRQILTQHDISYHSAQATRTQLLDLFNNNMESMRIAMGHPPHPEAPAASTRAHSVTNLVDGVTLLDFSAPDYAPPTAPKSNYRQSTTESLNVKALGSGERDAWLQANSSGQEGTSGLQRASTSTAAPLPPVRRSTRFAADRGGNALQQNEGSDRPKARSMLGGTPHRVMDGYLESSLSTILQHFQQGHAQAAIATMENLTADLKDFYGDSLQV